MSQPSRKKLQGLLIHPFHPPSSTLGLQYNLPNLSEVSEVPPPCLWSQAPSPLRSSHQSSMKELPTTSAIQSTRPIYSPPTIQISIAMNQYVIALCHNNYLHCGSVVTTPTSQAKAIVQNVMQTKQSRLVHGHSGGNELHWCWIGNMYSKCSWQL